MRELVTASSEHPQRWAYSRSGESFQCNFATSVPGSGGAFFGGGGGVRGGTFAGGCGSCNGGGINCQPELGLWLALVPKNFVVSLAMQVCTFSLRLPRDPR